MKVGEAAAAAVIADLRADDGMGSVVLYTLAVPSFSPPAGEFEPDGGCSTQPAGANVGQIKPFTFSNPRSFRPDGPDPSDLDRLRSMISSRLVISGA